MGHTNSTANYNLPQFVGTDKPTWLGDINNAFSAIDTAIANAATTATTADGKADALGTTVSGHTTQIGTLNTTVTAQGNTLNTVTALIGNGTPTTTDQTIIGAINELNAGISNIEQVENVSVSWESGYQDTGSTKVFIKNGVLYANLAIQILSGPFPTTLTKVATLSEGPATTAVLSGVETTGSWVPIGDALVHISSDGSVNLATTGESGGSFACLNGTALV